MCWFGPLSSRLSGASHPDLPLWTRPPPPDLILTRFWPDSDLTLSFLSFFFLGKIARKTTKKTRIFYPCRTPKIPGKEWKTLNKTSSQGKKKQGIPKKKGKEGEGKSAFSGPNRVKIRSESGPNQVWGEGFGGGRVQRGRSGLEASVAPRKVLTLSASSDLFGFYFLFLVPVWLLKWVPGWVFPKKKSKKTKKRKKYEKKKILIPRKGSLSCSLNNATLESG